MYIKYQHSMWSVTTIINGRIMFSSANTIQLAWDNLSQLIQRNNGEIR